MEIGGNYTFQNKKGGAANGAGEVGSWLGPTMVALYRPLYEVSFQLGAQGGLGFWWRGGKEFEGQAALCLSPWLSLKGVTRGSEGFMPWQKSPPPYPQPDT